MRIQGQKITLREMEKADVANKVKWFNDPDVNKTLLVEEKLELNKSLNWFERTRNDASRRDFVIESSQGTPIGIMALVHIDAVHGTAECFCAVGEKAYWGGGIGTEAHLLLVDWAFKNLGLHKIWAYIRPENTAIIKVVERIGFKVEGMLREEKYIGGKRVDIVRIGLLRREFYAAHPEFEKKGAR
ncbi:MAG: GNAT family protein [Planctomycetota bacterium]